MPHLTRCHWLEANAFLTEGAGVTSSYPEIRDMLQDSIQHVANIEGRRIIKTHLPFTFLPPQLVDTCKVVYVCRNPADTAVSYYHWYEKNFAGSFATFIEMFCKGYCSYGNYFDHLCSGLKMKNHPNVKFLWYEDILKDTQRTVQDISNFLDRPLTSENVEKIANLLSFANMKQNPMVNPTSGLAKQKTFMRRGIVGDWRNHFDEHMIATWNAWVESHNNEPLLKELINFRMNASLS